MEIDFDEYITGIPLIDEQHKHYVELVNKLIINYNNGGMGKDAINSYTKEIFDYAVEHFDAEEYLMRSANYPLYEEHLAKHNIFRDKVDEFVAEIDEEGIDIDEYVYNLNKWLISWFKIQVLDDDVKLAKFLKQKNR